MSTMMCAFVPDAALYTAASLPAELSDAVKLFARVSPSGKLSVELGGVDVAFGVIVTNPAAVWPVTVTLPVTAIASAGIGPTPATWKLFGELVLKTPVTPTLLRESTTRSGVIGTYELPPVWSCETCVPQRLSSANWFTCQMAFGTCGSCDTPT